MICIAKIHREAPRASIPDNYPKRHRRLCDGHIYCPNCRRHRCARVVAIHVDGTVRDVVCLGCRATYRARPVLRPAPWLAGR